MIEFLNVTKSFDDKLILENSSFTLNKGNLLGLIGPNGSGKTTIMNLILNRLDFNGTILIEGVPNYIYIKKSKESIGYVPDEPFLYQFLTGIEFVRFNLELHKIPFKKVRNQIDILFNLFDLDDYKNNLIKDYSFGMKRKVSLISVFLQKPKYILLDEPVLGLDAKSIIVIKKLLKIHAEKSSTILFSTHILDLMENLCNSVAILSNKKIIIHNSIIEMKKNELENIYLKSIGDEICKLLEIYNSDF